MRRIAVAPRADWRKKVEEAGLSWRAADRVTWNESAFYEFTAREVDALRAATNELEAMTLAAAGYIVENRLYSQMAISEAAAPLIEASWEARPPSLCARFDLAYDGANPPKLLECEADTPASLVEAAVAQRRWLLDTFPGRGQFNSIDERLVALWTQLTPSLPGRRVDFCSVDAEGGRTAAYLQDTAQRAGLTAPAFPIGEIGWNGVGFVGPGDRPLGAVCKFYPWEWMVREEFGKHVAAAATLWIEPPWKMLLSNKGILPVLWKLYPRHPYLLEAAFDGPGLMLSWVRKPLLGRGGANIALHQPGRDVETPGPYGAEGFVYQDLAPLKGHDGLYAVVDSWAIGHAPGDVAAGMGIRESVAPILSESSQFVPHLVD